jgi:hypothetical protein
VSTCLFRNLGIEFTWLDKTIFFQLSGECLGNTLSQRLWAHYLIHMGLGLRACWPASCFLLALLSLHSSWGDRMTLHSNHWSLVSSSQVLAQRPREFFATPVEKQLTRITVSSQLCFLLHKYSQVILVSDTAERSKRAIHSRLSN